MGPTMSCRLSVEYGRESAGNRRHQRDPIDFKFALGQRKREDLGIDKIERLIISGSGVRNPDGAPIFLLDVGSLVGRITGKHLMRHRTCSS